jgi:MerR family transcriptional regulator, thiopeptide resistance regulator
MADEVLKVGDLAARTGLSVRTLHHYDMIGLLSPSRRSKSGHRLYGRRDILRLQQIMSLRQIGLPLEEIREVLRQRNGAGRIIGLHIARLKERIAVEQDLCRRLEFMLPRLESAEIEEIIKCIEVTTMFEKYYTKEQLETLKKRAEELGPDKIRAAEAEWPQLIASVRAEMQKGTDPRDPRVQALVKRWNELVREFTGGDPGITRSLKNVYQGEPQFAAQQFLDGGVFEYVRKANTK